HDVDLGEDVVRVDGGGDEHVEDEGPEQGEGDAAESLPVGGAVEARRFKIDVGDIPDPDQEENEIVPEQLPHAHDDQRPQGDLLVGQPGDGREARERERVVQDAVVVV